MKFATRLKLIKTAFSRKKSVSHITLFTFKLQDEAIDGVQPVEIRYCYDGDIANSEELVMGHLQKVQQIRKNQHVSDVIKPVQPSLKKVKKPKGRKAPKSI